MNKARLHSYTQKCERHYQIDSLLRSGQVAHQQFMMFPGGRSLAFSDWELIKARGDGKVSSLGRGIRKGLTAVAQLETNMGRDRSLLL